MAEQYTVYGYEVRSANDSSDGGGFSDLEGESEDSKDDDVAALNSRIEALESKVSQQFSTIEAYIGLINSRLS